MPYDLTTVFQCHSFTFVTHTNSLEELSAFYNLLTSRFKFTLNCSQKQNSHNENTLIHARQYERYKAEHDVKVIWHGLKLWAIFLGAELTYL